MPQAEPATNAISPSRSLTHFGVGGFGRFVAVGIVNTIFGYGLFPALYLCLGDRVPLWLLLAFNYIACPLFSFMTHKFLTFASAAPTGREAIKFTLFWVIVFPLNLVLLEALKSLPKAEFILAQLSIGVVLMISNYIVLHKCVFGRQSDQANSRAPLIKS